MSELKISSDFTIEDIHKIREYNYERRKDMSFAEYKADVKKGANEMLEIIERLKNEKASKTV